MTTEKITFNDLPKAVAQVLEKISDLEINVSVLREEIQNGPSKAKDHVPMKIEEACEFLQMKKATMYYHLQQGSVPATRTGKCYIFFKDELIKWAESGRKNNNPLSTEDINASLSKRKGKNR